MTVMISAHVKCSRIEMVDLFHDPGTVTIPEASGRHLSP